MKADTAGQIIGIALEPYTGTTTSSISVAIDNDYYTPDTQLYINSDGNIGIGTTTPEYKFHVIGDIAATSFINISTRESKKDIEYLTEEEKTTILEEIEGIDIAKYHYIKEDLDDPLRIGLIAEESPSEILSNTGRGVDIYKLSTYTLAGLQELNKKVGDLEMRVIALEEGRTGGGDGGGVNMEGVVAYLESLGLRIVDGITTVANLVADTFSTNSLYVRDNVVIGTAEKPVGITLYDPNGQPYCVRLEVGGALVSEAGECPSNNSGQMPSGETSSGISPTSDTTPPTITILGNNPAEVELGSTYVDLGATVTDDTDQNLGVTASIDGTEVGDTGNIQIDTSTPGERLIEFRATDQAGNSVTVSRIVNVVDPNAVAEETPIVSTDPQENPDTNGASPASETTTTEDTLNPELSQEPDPQPEASATQE